MTFVALVFRPFSFFISHPLLALLPAVAFAALYLASRRGVVAAAAVVWALYACYEYAIKRRWMCTGECNIRVDLLLMYPLLWIVSLAALIVGVVALTRRRDPKAGV